MTSLQLEAVVNRGAAAEWGPVSMLVAAHDGLPIHVATLRKTIVGESISSQDCGRI